MSTFILRDISDELQDLTLDAVLSELQAHRDVKAKIVNQGILRKINNNISLLQCQKLELQRVAV